MSNLSNRRIFFAVPPTSEGHSQTLYDAVVAGEGEQTLKDAFRYMFERHAEEATGKIYNYNDGWTSEKDFVIARQWLGVLPESDRQTVRHNYDIVVGPLSSPAVPIFTGIYFRSKTLR